MTAPADTRRPGPADGPPGALSADLRIALMRTVRRLRAEKSDADITDSQYAVLGLLDRYGAMTSAALAEKERVRPPSMTRIVAGLLEAGLVARAAHPEDGRAHLVTLTDAGHAAVDETRRRRDEWLCHQLAACPPRTAGPSPAPPSCCPAQRRVSGAGRPAGTFRSLAHRDYRLWAGAAIVSNTGTWMQRIAQDWLVLVDLTADSALAVGVVTGLQFLPMLLLAPWAGPHRRPLREAAHPPGQPVPAGAPGRRPRRAGARGRRPGLARLRLRARPRRGHGLRRPRAPDVRHLARAARGPAQRHRAQRRHVPPRPPARPGHRRPAHRLGGTGPVFVLNAVSFAFTVAVLAMTRTRSPGQGTQGLSGLERMREAAVYVRTRGDVLLVLFLVFVVGTFGLNFQLTTAVMARLEFDRGPESYGLLGTFLAVGSLTGALLAASRERARMRLVVGAVLAFGVTSSIAALMPTYWTFAASLVLVGLSALTLMTAANATVQLSTPPELRGRVMALYFAVFIGGTPLGAPVVGWVGETFGARWTIAVGGVTALLAGAAALAFLARRSVLDLHYDADARPRLRLETSPRHVDDPEHDRAVA